MIEGIQFFHFQEFPAKRNDLIQNGSQLKNLDFGQFLGQNKVTIFFSRNQAVASERSWTPNSRWKLKKYDEPIPRKTDYGKGEWTDRWALPLRRWFRNTFALAALQEK